MLGQLKTRVLRLGKKLAGTETAHAEISALRAQVRDLSTQVDDLNTQFQGRFKQADDLNRKLTREQKLIRLGVDKILHSVSSSVPDFKPDRELTDQELFWAGVGGTGYALDNHAESKAKASKLKLWSEIFKNITDVGDALELGCNVGLNLQAIHELRPELALSGLELNASAASTARAHGIAEILQGSIFDFVSERRWDLVYIRGVLMHLNVEMLPRAYEVMNAHARKYVCINENFSENPEPIHYKGRNDLLVSRHFANEFVATFPDWKILAFGWDSYNSKAPSNRDRRWFVLSR